MKWIEKLQVPPTENEVIELISALAMVNCSEVARRLVFQRDRLVTEVGELRELLQALLIKLPHERHPPFAAYCAGCGNKRKESCKLQRRPRV